MPAEEVAPLWAPPPPHRHIITTIALWAGVGLGGAALLLGLLGIVVAQSAPASRQQTELTGALVFLVLGAVVFFPTFLNLTGYAQILTTSTGMVGAIFGGAFSELGIVGSIIVFLMIANTAVVVSTQVGGGRYGVPLAGIPFNADHNGADHNGAHHDGSAVRLRRCRQHQADRRRVPEPLPGAGHLQREP